MNYSLFATDIDGTLLNSQKEISKANLEAIQDTFAAGKEFVLCSGRCLDEMVDFFSLLPQLRYVLTCSGAIIYDRKEEAFLYRKQLPPVITKRVFDYVKEHPEILPQAIVDNHSVISRDMMESLEEIKMDQYRELFYHTAHIVKDVCAYMEARDWKLEKICLYHRLDEGRTRTREVMKDWPVALAYSEERSLEVSPQGLDKGAALDILCQKLGIGLDQVIFIGDGYNDERAMECVGFPIAVGNAPEDLKKKCRAVVADCDHDGVAKALRSYYLPSAM